MLLDASRDDAHRDREYILRVPRHEDPFDYAVESGDEYGDACTEHDIPARVRAMAEREMQTAQHRPGKEQDQRGQTDPAQFGAGEKIHVVNVGRSTGVAPGHTCSLRIAIGVSGDDILVCAHAHRMIVPHRLCGALASKPLAVGAIVEIGRASCRERVCQYVLITVGDVTLKKKKN